MRNVEYITNGFGGPGPMPSTPNYGIQIATPDPRFINDGPSGSNAFQYAPPETKIRLYLEAAQFPQHAIEAAVRTFKSSGVAGFQKLQIWMEAVGQAFDALENSYRSGFYRTSGKTPTQTYRKMVDAALNTATSRVGLNPLISSIRSGYTNIINAIPNSSVNPDQDLGRLMDSTWLNYRSLSRMGNGLTRILQ